MAAPPIATPPTRAAQRARLLIMAGALVCWAAVIVGRLVFLQVVSYDALQARVIAQGRRTVQTPANRGDIADRTGRVLASSVDVDSIYAVPNRVGDPALAAQALCRALKGCDRRGQDELDARLRQKRDFVYVRRRVSPTEAQQVAALALPGIGFTKETRRVYPHRELAAHVLGYTGLDNQGLAGVEATLDSVVRGREGLLLALEDARHNVFSRVERVPTTGASVELTIDAHLQYIAERELKAAVEAHRADGGSLVALDPHTGDILAMANWPTFNPNVFGSAPADARRNRSTQDIYEPGSTFKLVTASAAIEHGIVSPDDVIDVSAGMIRFGSRVINDMNRYGPLSFTDVIVKSSNVGVIKMGARVGADRMLEYVRAFGFGQPTSRDFSGESGGIVYRQLDPSALASVSMGYQVGVTPLQVVTATSVVANGGTLYEPRLVRAVTSDGVRTETRPTARRRVISEKTAATMTAIMEAVVERGTATRAKVAGYTVAGKSGTADKLIGGRYSASQQNVSFAGFVPSRNPVLAMIVMIDSPREGGDTGGLIAAPVFQRVATAAMRHLGVVPNIDAAPPVVVPRQAAERTTSAAPEIIQTAVVRPTESTVPDLTGFGAREAVHELVRLGLTPRVRGQGLVVAQTPAAGSPIEPGGLATLTLVRVPPAALVPGVVRQ
jgi:cell division protein FtsI (penicillin-binding protein 3)